MDKNKSIALKQPNMLTVSDRLRYLIDKVGIKQAHLANKLGVTPQAIHQLCAGKQNSSKYTQKIAYLLNANEDWIKTGEGDPFLIEKPAGTKKVLEFPVYQLSQLKTVKNIIARLGSLAPQERYVTIRRYHAESLGFYVEDSIWAPKFDIGDIILIEPISFEHLIDGDIALLYRHKADALVFCYIQKIQGNLKVGWQPNTNSKPTFFIIDANDVIYGAYRECLKTS